MFFFSRMKFEIFTNTSLKSILTFFFTVPADGFLLGCVFAVADYPEQMADKQLLATWKRVSCNAFPSRICTHP